MGSKSLSIPSEQVKVLMSRNVEQSLIEACAISSVKWDVKACTVKVLGSQPAVEKAAQQLQRIVTHCRWGISEPKVFGILRPRKDCTTAKCRFSPMHEALKDFTINLTAKKPSMTIGTDRGNDLVVQGQQVSRQHAIVEFMVDRGSVYVVDSSTNGTILNGKRLPPKASAKVVLWHGDELLLQDPAV